ncbi:MAG: class I SAM-dependent methyltransferase [Bacteroidota bacterium]
MDDFYILNKPEIHNEIEAKSKQIGFTMPSDLYIGSLLKTLITAKPKSNLLELGTGIGLSLSWMVDAMDNDSTLTTVDNDPKLIKIANDFFNNKRNVNIVCADGAEWIKSYTGENFDLIFADAWPGKYSELDEVLALLKVGGLYVIDDMKPQQNWPEGHDKKAANLVELLEAREDLNLTKMNWSTGVIICAKKF